MRTYAAIIPVPTGTIGTTKVVYTFWIVLGQSERERVMLEA